MTTEPTTTETEAQAQSAPRAALPVIAIVGRPNVGKSTLFNALTRSRDALVADVPGLTRDRRYGIWRSSAHGNALLVDTGGLTDDDDAIARLITSQARAAVAEADVLALVVDARDGMTASDEILTRELRRSGKPIVLVLNKLDGLDPDAVAGEFHSLGLGDPIGVSAAHRRGLHALADVIRARMPAQPQDQATHEKGGIAVCVVGRPNVGKSTLVNRLVGEERVVAHDMPGTTRDSIRVPFTLDDRDYVLVDTAGIRRRAKVTGTAEKFSIVKALQAIEQSDVAVLMFDASAGITEQDVSLLGLVLQQGRAVTIALNKWDSISTAERRQLRTELARKTAFATFCPIVPTSALRGSGLQELVQAVNRCHASAFPNLTTGIVSRILEDAVEHRPPPLARGRRIKLRYAHQGGSNPPVIVIHGNQTELVPDHYRRYLEARFRAALGLVGAPVEIRFRTGENPFKGRKNTLTPRQQRSRKRLLRHVRR